MFLAGETIIYGSIGVCEIKEISEYRLTGTLRQYYVLQPVDTVKNVIYVPVDNEKLVSRMRAVPSKNEITKFIKEVDSEEVLWIDNNIERTQVYREIIADGELKKNIRLLRALSRRSVSLLEEGKHLPKSDERIYKECSKLISHEISFIMQLDIDEALQLALT